MSWLRNTRYMELGVSVHISEFSFTKPIQSQFNPEKYELGKNKPKYEACVAFSSM
jgi:hypothetical protein